MATETRWSVWREDDSGNKFEAAQGLTREDADKMQQEFERRGHKQVYWVRRYIQAPDQ